MSDSQVHHIPRHGRAGVAFAGVELHQAWISLAGFMVGFIVAANVGAFTGLAVIAGSYFLNKVVVELQQGAMPGWLSETAYALGIRGYSRGLARQQSIYRGDAKAGNGVMAASFERMVAEARELLLDKDLL
jgi:hypothetical protein